MQLAEHILYGLAKLLYRSNIALTQEQKESRQDINKYENLRNKDVSNLTTKALKYGIKFEGKVVVDFGCATGSMAQEYSKIGANKVIGIDIDDQAIKRAKKLNHNPDIKFFVGSVNSIPCEDDSVDTIISFASFEHVTHPKEIISEFYRILKPNGKVFIGTWGWYHPFGHHLYGVMPVPWCHVYFSEKTIMHVCRKVYNSDWYQYTIFDVDESGNKKEKYSTDCIPNSYVNKLLIRDFEKIIKKSLFKHKIYPRAFNHKFAKWTRFFLHVPWIKEYITSYIYIILEKDSANKMLKAGNNIELRKISEEL